MPSDHQCNDRRFKMSPSGFFSSPYSSTVHSCFKFYIFTPNFPYFKPVPIRNRSWRNTGHFLKRLPWFSHLLNHCSQINLMDLVQHLLSSVYPNCVTWLPRETYEHFGTQFVPMFFPNFRYETYFKLVVHHLVRSNNHSLYHISILHIALSSHNL